MINDINENSEINGLAPCPVGSISCRCTTPRHPLRRRLRLGIVTVLILGAISAPPLLADIQDEWRRCRKCSVLFYNRDLKKSSCAAGDLHLPDDRNFMLPYDIPESAHGQVLWRFCTKCHAMFYNEPSKGRCPAGGGHLEAGNHFVIPYNISISGDAQGDWRYCKKCSAMYYNGYSDKGRCPGGDGHETPAKGYNFVLKIKGKRMSEPVLKPATD